MGIESVLGAVAGPVVGGLLGGSDGGSGSTQSSSSVTPWGPLQGYLVGGNKTKTLKPGVVDTGNNPDSDYNIETTAPGIADEGAKLYQQSGWTPQQQSLLDNRQTQLANRANSSLYTDIVGGADAVLRGQYDPNVQRIANTNLSSDRAGQGSLDPTQSMQQLLSGQTNNPYLAGMQKAATQTAQTQYDDAVQSSEQSLNYNILPGIRSGAEAAGGYGGSRQGIAEGLAAGLHQQQLDRNARDLSTASTNAGTQIQNNAYNTAQQNMYGTANNLNNQAQSSGQFNAQLGLQNNSQDIAKVQQQMANRQNGLNFLGTGTGMQDTNYTNQQNGLTEKNNYDWKNLQNYQGVIQPIAGMGNTSTQTTPYYQNQGANILGGAATGLGIGQKLFGDGGMTNKPMQAGWDGGYYDANGNVIY